MLSALMLALFQVADPGVVTTRQAITPAGVQSVFAGKVWGLAFAANPDEILVVTWDRQRGWLHRVNWKRNAVRQTHPLQAPPGLQGLLCDPISGRTFLSGTSLMEVSAGGVTALTEGLGSKNAGPPALARSNDKRGRRLLALPLIHANKLALFDLNTNALAGSIPVPVAPFAAALTGGGYAYVSNWGGRTPSPGDQTAPTGLSPAADRVVIDARGVLASGTITKVDLETMRVEKVIEAGLHPTALAAAPASNRLFAANTNDDTVLVLDTRTDKPVATWPLQPFDRAVAGIAPTALLLSPDEATLFVACGGINAVLVLDAASGTMRGMIPTGWYPNALALSPDGKSLAVSTLLGVGSGSESEDKPRRRYVHANRGTVHIIPVPDAAQLANYTAAVAENNRLPLAGRGAAQAPSGDAPPQAVPLRPGEPSPIEHVVYIIKENRTYDQVFGDLGEGQRRPVARHVRRRRLRQPPQAGARVRPARQLLRHRRQQRRRASVGHAGQ